jgi:hypothetical protein
MLIALSLIGSAAFAAGAPAPIDACKTYFVCGTYAGQGDFIPVGQPVSKVDYTITASSGGPNIGNLHIHMAAKSFPLDEAVQLAFQPDGRFTLMAGKETVGSGMCQGQMCSFALVMDPSDNDSGNIVMLRFNAGQMEFLWQVGTPAALHPQMQAILPKAK